MRVVKIVTCFETLLYGLLVNKLLFMCSASLKIEKTWFVLFEPPKEAFFFFHFSWDKS